MLNQNLKLMLSGLLSAGAISLTIVSPAFSQIVPESVQPTIEPLQPAGLMIQPITPQASPVPNPATHSNPASNISPMQLTGQFTFTNALEYSHCLEDILRLYQTGAKFRPEDRRSTCRDDIFQAYRNRPLPKEQALELIQMADFYATSLLSVRLYPLAGQRQRVRQWFGFVYAIDAKPPMVLQSNP